MHIHHFKAVVYAQAARTTTTFTHKNVILNPFSLIFVSKLRTNRNIVYAVFMYPLDDCNGNSTLRATMLHYLIAAYGNL